MTPIKKEQSEILSHNIPAVINAISYSMKELGRARMVLERSSYMRDQEDAKRDVTAVYFHEVNNKKLIV